MTATWRDRMAVGTKRKEIWRICSPKPGISLCATASVASGVTSRRAGPVPPVVSTKAATRVYQFNQRGADGGLLVGDQACSN
jgi:hypothetical protein